MYAKDELQPVSEKLFQLTFRFPSALSEPVTSIARAGDLVVLARKSESEEAQQHHLRVAKRKLDDIEVLVPDEHHSQFEACVADLNEFLE